MRWRPGGEVWERATELVLSTFPGFRIEVRRVDGLPLDARIAGFCDQPGHAKWRARFAAQRVTHVWGIHIRAIRDGRPGLVRIDAMRDIYACDSTLARWE